MARTCEDLENVTITGNFTNLDDTPTSYVGEGDKVVVVKADESGLEFRAGGAGGVDTFKDLTDTPSTYIGQQGKVATVNATETGLEFTTPTGGTPDYNLAESTNTIGVVDDTGSVVYLEITGVGNDGFETQRYVQGEISGAIGNIVQLETDRIRLDRRSIIGTFQVGEKVFTKVYPVALKEMLDVASSGTGTETLDNGEFLHIANGRVYTRPLTETYGTESRTAINSVNGNVIGIPNFTLTYYGEAPQVGDTIVGRTSGAVGKITVLTEDITTIESDTYYGTFQVGEYVAVPQDGYAFRLSDLSDMPSSGIANANKYLKLGADGVTYELATVESGESDFLGLTDTPSSYVGNVGKQVVVNSSANGLEFLDVKHDFTDLNDTPNDYTGKGGSFVLVNSAENGLEFLDTVPSNIRQLKAISKVDQTITVGGIVPNFEITQETNGITVSNGEITFVNSGTYRIQVQLNIANSNNTLVESWAEYWTGSAWAILVDSGNIQERSASSEGLFIIETTFDAPSGFQIRLKVSVPSGTASLDFTTLVNGTGVPSATIVAYELQADILGTGGAGASAFTDLSDTPNSYTGQAGKLAFVNGAESGLEFNTITKSTVGLDQVQNVNTTTTANITDSTDKRFVTDSQKVVIGNTSGTNTGDQDLSGLATKANVLELDNTTPFTPTGDNQPATKKYVDDNSGGGGGSRALTSFSPQIINSSTDSLKSITVTSCYYERGDNFITIKGKLRPVFETFSGSKYMFIDLEVPLITDQSSLTTDYMGVANYSNPNYGNFVAFVSAGLTVNGKKGFRITSGVSDSYSGITVNYIDFNVTIYTG